MKAKNTNIPRKSLGFALSEAEIEKISTLVYASLHGTNRSAWLRDIINREHAKLEQSQKKGAK